MDVIEHLLRAPSQGDEVDPHLVQFIQVCICGQLGIEDQFLGLLPCPLFPELYESQNLPGLFFFPKIGVGVDKHPLLRVLGQEGKDSFLPATALGDIVFLNQRVLPVKGDRMEVEVERSTPFELQLCHGVEPEPHEPGVTNGIDPATVFGQE